LPTGIADRTPYLRAAYEAVQIMLVPAHTGGGDDLVRWTKHICAGTQRTADCKDSVAQRRVGTLLALREESVHIQNDEDSCRRRPLRFDLGKLALDGARDL
jgi:hypothetical protein